MRHHPHSLSSTRHNTRQDMGFSFTLTPKSTTKSTTATEYWGMGLLLVFFPEEDNSNNNHHHSSATASPLSSSSSPSMIKRSNSSLISTKAQSTISICALFVFLTLLLFTLSTFEPSTSSLNNAPRRILSQKSTPSPTNPNSSPFSFFKMWSSDPGGYSNHPIKRVNPVALQGMGVLYRRGTRAVNDFIIGHVAEDTTVDEFRLFLRVIHRSGLSSKSDMAFLYSSSSSLSKFGSVIEEENDSFSKLIRHYKESNNTSKRNSALRFDVTQFVKSVKKDMGEPLWGKRIRGNFNNSTEDRGDSGELTQLSYGSILGFEVNELDPENSLAGFLDHVPMSLRRWACYPMLLGRVRRNFKHIMLVDVRKLIILGDPLVRVRTQTPESVFISLKQESVSNNKHSKRNSDKTQPHYQANSAVLMGGARGVRRLSTAMLTEIVRASMQHKKKSSVTESGILSQLVANEHILKNIHLVTSTESIPEASSLIESRSSSSQAIVMMQRGNSDYEVDYYSIIMKQICSCEAVDSSVYKNC
ncbi:hypothetical protein Dsin_011840 [Dipteronia sinensis]|uniref:DUF7780 domain-containing protein n=1 Tax=Dipteronia sinensis TaxID=43782 RepID=A0AAE0E8V6_9ROSI|nr:hypothetical protein Dsin_011840 [Dipteronia sinensis]